MNPGIQNLDSKGGTANAPSPAPAEDAAGRFPQWFCAAVAVSWVTIGLAILLAAFDDSLLEHERVLRRPDPLLEFGTRGVMVVAGWFHLLLTGLLFFLRDPVRRALLVVWGGSVCALYRLGFGWAGGGVDSGASCPVVGLTADKVGLNPGLFGFGWGLVLVGSVLGALLQLLLEWRRGKRREAAAFMERWRESHK